LFFAILSSFFFVAPLQGNSFDAGDKAIIKAHGKQIFKKRPE
jgi:hypothetical protein